MTQADLGEAVGVSKQTISRWETGRDTPQGGNLIALTRALDLPEGWFAQAAPASATAREPETDTTDDFGQEALTLDRLIARARARLLPVFQRAHKDDLPVIYRHLVQQIDLIALLVERVPQRAVKKRRR